MGQYQCCKIQNFLLILDLKNISEKVHQKKVRFKTVFFWSPGIFWRNSLFSYLFYSAQFLKYSFGSEIGLKYKYFYAHVDLCREAEYVSSFVIFYMKI
jgi:hypothetical protein